MAEPDTSSFAMKSRIPKNIFSAVEARRYGTYSRSMRNTYRYNNRLMSNLIASPNWFFKKMTRIRSSKSLGFECHDKLYAENNRKCYALRGLRGAPTLIYSIDSDAYSGKWRYESHMTITKSGMSNPNPPRCDLRLLLTSKSLLEVREENTGKLIDLIDLNSPDSPDVKFHTLRWDPNLDQVIAISSRPRASSDIFCHFVVLEICPCVRKVLRIPIRKDVFGQKLSNVILFDGILQVMYRDEVVKWYDFNSIRRNNRIVDGFFDDVLLITDLGEPVYVVRDSNEMLTLGGHPWHYIACSRRSKEHQYTVRTIDHEKLASFAMNEYSTVAFHPDDSGIITHFEKEAVTNYKMVYDENTGRASLKKVREMKLINSERKEEREATEQARRSPRIIELSALPRIDEEERTLVSDDFENELNLNLLMGLDRGDPRRRGVIQFFDNGTGTHIKTMNFNRTLPECTEYFVTLDLDVLIVFAARENGTTCEADVYRLLHREAWGDRCPTKLYELPGAHGLQRRNPDEDYTP